MIEVSNKTKSKIELKTVIKTAERFLQVYKKKRYELSIVFVGDRVIRKLNNNYRKIDKITDILTFEGEELFLGEIIIDYQQIKRQSKKFSGSVKKELIFILVHGLLHLIGYDDKTEKDRERMIRMGEEFIGKHKL